MANDEIDLLADDDGVDLLADIQPAKQKKYSDLSPEDQQKALEIARQHMVSQNPGMPRWAQDMVLSLTPKEDHPMLNAIANDMEAGTNFIPVTAGGILQGVNTPFQGVASFIPGKIAQDYVKADARSYFPKPRTDTEANLQTMADFGGALGPIGELFGALKAGTQLARVPKALQNATAIAGTGAIATPGDATDKAIGAGEGLALGAAGKVIKSVGNKVSVGLPQIIRGLTNEATNQKLIDAIRKPHDIMEDTAEQLYEQVRRLVSKRNIKVNVKPETLDEITEYPSMNIKTRDELIAKAKAGDYEALHKLQSSLYKKGTKAVSNADPVIETQGENILGLRDRLNKQIEDHLIQNGHVDVAHVLKQGKNTYKKLMDTFYNKLLPKGLGDVVHSDVRYEPEDARGIFPKNVKSVRQFFAKYPEVNELIKGINEKELAKQALKNTFLSTGVAGGGLMGAKTLFDLLV